MRVLTNRPLDIERAIREAKDEPLQLAPYAKAKLPDPARWIYGLIFVTDDVGGAVLAFADGTHWRRVTDRAIIA